MQLITGATGQIGSRLLAVLSAKEFHIRTLGRRPITSVQHIMADLEWATMDELQRACEGVRTVFHCAGYAHTYPELNDRGLDVSLHRRVNFEGTQHLVEAAGRAGVKQFVFLSSVKATGEPGNACADETWQTPPLTNYGKAKRAAETAVLEAGQKFGMHAVNLRLAMVYGCGAGNLERMAAMIQKGWFPALPETGNKRSLIHIDDAISAINVVARDPRSAGRTYIAAEAETYSGRAIYDAIRTALRLKKPVIYTPELLLRSTAYMGDALEYLFGKRVPLDSEVLDKLLGSAWYSPARIERELGWRAQVTLPLGLKKMLGQTIMGQNNAKLLPAA